VACFGGFANSYVSLRTILTFSGAENVVTDWYGECALASGTARCRGDNQEGRRGVAGVIGNEPPTVIAGLGAVTALATDTNRVCAVNDAAQVWCWGDNRNALDGFGTRTPVEIRPTLVTVAPAVDVSLNVYAACIVTASRDQVWCWGNRTNAALGDGGGTTGYSAPVRVLGL